MSDLRIKGLQGGLDLLEEFYAPTMLPMDQDPTVVERCPDVLSQTIKLCQRFHPDLRLPKSGIVEIATPDTIFDSVRSGARGLMAIEASFFSIGGVRQEDYAQTNVSLHTRDIPDPLLTVYPNEVWRKTPRGLRAGRHSELNYLLSLVRQMNDTAFPKASK